jgi:mono/diheme cytochrome c family protein
MPKMKIAVAAAIAALTIAGVARAQGLTPDDYKYLQAAQGLTPQSAVIAELTPNEQQSLHSAIDDLKTYPEGQNRQVRRYLSLVYGRECKRWAAAHPGQNCSPSAVAAIEPGKEISDKICASCHLFGTESAPSYRQMASERDWNSHKVEHALRHSPDMVPLKLTPEMLDQLAAYINSFK